LTIIPWLIYGNLGCDDIISVVRGKDKDFLHINPDGPLSLIRGWIGHFLGAGHNIRFNSPWIDTKVVKDKNGNYVRKYEEDEPIPTIYVVDLRKEKDEWIKVEMAYNYCRAAKHLFPSYEGEFNVSTDDMNSFYAGLMKGENDREDAIKFLSILMGLTLGGEVVRVEKEDKVLFNMGSVSAIFKKSGSGSFRDRIRAMNEVVEFFSSTEPNEGVSELSKYIHSREFLLQLYLVLFLNNKDEYESFVSYVKSAIRGNEDAMSRCFLKSGTPGWSDKKYHVLRELFGGERAFPFGFFNPPPEAGGVKYYNREEDKFIEHQKFNDYVETALLELVCLLLYKPNEGRYCTKHLSAECGLRRFFEKRPKLFDIDNECREDWLRVVSDIKDSNISYLESWEGCRNELEW
jgi:hypothetical protein